MSKVYTTVAEVLADVASKTLSIEHASPIIAELEAAKRPMTALRCKVGEKGGVSVYGLNSKWPVTMYAEQWERLFDFVPQLKKFIADNKPILKLKQAA